MPYGWAGPFQGATLDQSLLKNLLLGTERFKALRWTVSISTVDWVYRESLLKALRLGWTLLRRYVRPGYRESLLNALLLGTERFKAVR